jgi:uncharacterized protein (TIGR03000 family)
MQEVFVMYSIVLMMSLADGATAPTTNNLELPTLVATRGTQAHELYRHGCHGCAGYYGCHGCNGYGGYGCYGCWGGYGYGCSGCYGCWGGYGRRAGYGYSGGYYSGYSPYAPNTGMIGRAQNAPATVVISLPPDAKLSFDDRPTASTSALRSFVSPPLDTGKNYYYTLRAEANREGRDMVITRRIAVRAGQETRVTFEFAGPSVAHK